MITLKGTKPVIWEKTYYSKNVEKVKEEHDQMHPEYLIEEIIEHED